MNTAIYTAPVVKMEKLKDVFIELTAKNCNTRCHNCYIKFPYTKNIKDFIKIDSIKKMLSELEKEDIGCIYLTGAEPMTHPDFNSILRLCLKKTNVCIMTNASFINEKKARFLKNVERESFNRILFKLSFVHYDEQRNDTVRYRGSFRQNLYALKCLDKYEFINILSVANYYKEPHSDIIENFTTVLNNIGIEDAIIQVNEWVSDTTPDDMTEAETPTDCLSSRTLTATGVFACPFLANDYRGRCGSDFTDYSDSVRLETNFCAACLRNKDKIFSVDIDWD